MTEISPRPGGRVSRSTRERRAYRLVLIGGSAAAVAAVGFVLAIFGVIGAGVPLLAAVVAGVSGLLFRRTVS